MISKTTPTGRLIHFLGSLNFALLLLGTIAIACAVATLFESRFDSKVAQVYIYKAPWFIFWLSFLCVNLFCVTLTRWPWQKKHIGFVITHYGIITLLAGAVIGSFFGFEGNVTLHTEKPPSNRLTTSRSVVQIQGPGNRPPVSIPFDAAAVRPSEKRPHSLRVPGTNWKIVASDYAPELMRDSYLETDLAGQPGVILKMTSSLAAQTLEIPLLLGEPATTETDLFGLAKIRWLPKLPENSTQWKQETQMVFTKFAPVIQSEGSGSGIPVLLSADGQALTVGSEMHARADLEGKEIKVGAAKIQLMAYWPDFAMQNGRPSTKSQEPNNPAALLRVKYPAASLQRELALEMTPSDSGVAYRLVRDGVVYTEGKALPGEEFGTGWMDWSVRVEEFQPAARIAGVTRKVGENEPATGIQGFWAYLDTGDGKTGEPRWIESGRFTTLAAGEQEVRVGYGLEVIQVPFTMKLLSFEVPRYEGTDTPANYISRIEFRDSQTGKIKVAEAKMNHPASWPGGVWAVTTGFNYKFSQAEWNPRDLGETILQVLYDPGWFLKWVGSLAICIGIGLMFYWKPKKA